MPLYSLMFLDLSKVTTTASGFNNTGTGSHLLGHTFTIAAGAKTGSLQISDGDTWFDDDERSQLLGTPQVLNGISYPADYVVEQEYSFTVSDGSGTWKVFAISVHETTRSDLNVVGFVFSGAMPPKGVDLTITATAEGTANTTPYTGLALPMCFGTGTRIATPAGLRPIEALRPGDLVLTADGTPEPVVMITARTLRFDRPGAPARPVRIAPGALGGGLPWRPLVLSPQHRLRPWGADGQTVLGPAAGLCALPGVRRMAGRRQVRYLHLLLTRHALVLAEGVVSETLLGGDLVLAHLGPLAQRLAQGARDPALPLLDMAATRALAQAMRGGLAPMPGADQASAFASARDLPATSIASVAAMKPSRSPSSTPCVSEVSNPVRRSFTI